MRWAFWKYRYWMVQPVGFHGERPHCYIVLAVSQDHAEQIGYAASEWAHRMLTKELKDV